MKLTSNRAYILTLSALLIIAALTRFYGIWHWDLVDDEYFTATHAYERYKSFVNPTYYSLVVFTYEIFGSDPWLSRLPSLLISIFTIPIVFTLCRKHLGNSTAIFTVILIMFSSWHLYFSQLARFYSGVFLFSFISYVFFYRAIYSTKAQHLALALASSLIAISFHVTAIFVPFSVAFAYLIILASHTKLNESIETRNIKIYLLLCISGGIALLPFLFGVLDRWVSTGQSWGYGAILIIPQVAKYIQIPIVIAALFGTFAVFQRNKIATIFLVASVAIPCILLMIASSFMAVSPSYVFYILAPTIVLAGIACGECHDLLAKNKQVLLSYLPITLIVTLLLPSFASHFLAKSTLNFNDAITFTEQELRSNDKVLSFIPGFKTSKHSDYTLLPFISFERDNSVDWKTELDKIIEDDSRVWILLSSKRKPIANALALWLSCNSTLAWQQYAFRLDYEVDGYQIFLASNKIKAVSERNFCRENQ